MSSSPPVDVAVNTAVFDAPEPHPVRPAVEFAGSRNPACREDRSAGGLALPRERRRRLGAVHLVGSSPDSPIRQPLTLGGPAALAAPCGPAPGKKQKFSLGLNGFPRGNRFMNVL
jgi:hypothetical protein